MERQSDPDEIVEIRTTFAGKDAAEACARRIVAARLAACGQLDGPVRSIYHWRNAVEAADEWRCTFKTTRRRAPACMAAIVSEHPYENPEVLLAGVSASPSYASWVREIVAEP